VNYEIYIKYFRMIKSRRMRWTGHVAHMGKKMHLGIWWESQKERDHFKNLDVAWRIIL
jgi:hypothetical protein